MKWTLLDMLIATALGCTFGRVPCIDDCPSIKRPVCALDPRAGARTFDNICLLDSFNLCFRTKYEPQPEFDYCSGAYDEEYSRESKIPYKNPKIIQLYQNKLNSLYF